MILRFRAEPNQSGNLRVRVYSQDRATLLATVTATTVPNPITETIAGSGSYECDVGAITGDWYVLVDLLSTGEITADGFASDALPEMLDTISAGSGGSSDITAQLDAIQAKTNLITTGMVTVQSPVNEDGSVNPIVIGDDYRAEHGRSFDFFIDPVSGVDPDTATCFFGGERENKGSWLVTGSVAVVDTKWRMRFELASDDTIDCLKGCYGWSAELRPAESKRITRITGEVELVRSYTIE